MIALKLDQNIRIVFSIVNNWLIKKQENTVFFIVRWLLDPVMHILLYYNITLFNIVFVQFFHSNRRLMSKSTRRASRTYNIYNLSRWRISYSINTILYYNQKQITPQQASLYYMIAAWLKKIGWFPLSCENKNEGTFARRIWWPGEMELYTDSCYSFNV